MAVSEAQLKKMLSKYKYRDLSVREILNVIGLYRDLKPLPDSYGAKLHRLPVGVSITSTFCNSTFNLLWTTASHSPSMTRDQELSTGHSWVVLADICLKDPSLMPDITDHVFNDGTCRELLSLSGTIPVPYKGNTYNIPICLWLLDTYPYNPPICFVKPTNTMTIKTGKHVDANGKIYLPYLHEWKHPPSDLLGLIQILIVVFGEEPPVFSRYPAPAPYMYPAAGPPNTSYMPGDNPPYPAGHPSNQSGYPDYYPAGGPYPPTSGPQMFPQPPVPHPQVTSSGPARDGTIGEDTIRASLISAVSDKLRWRMKEEIDRAQAELNALKRTEEDLKKGHQKLEEMVTRLDQEVTEVDKNIETLRKKDEELGAVVEKMESQSEYRDIDEVIVPTAPLYKQILNLYAEENAIEDTIFYLGEALRRGVIDLDVFLKHVRLLSRKQFQLRALMQKARKTAGLSDLY